jgi:hypothetical protein
MLAPSATKMQRCARSSSPPLAVSCGTGVVAALAVFD